jgi:hypothetical protein
MTRKPTTIMSTTYSRSILLAGWLVSLLPLVFSYQVRVSDTDYSRQICSGMWADSTTYINGIHPPNRYRKRRPSLTSSPTVTFDGSSQGQLAAVIYEWSDVDYLGKTTSFVEDLPVSAGARHTAANVDSPLLNGEPAENIHLHNRRTSFRLL